MKWFKHRSRSGDDPDIDDSFTLFKAEGPYVFWRTLEVMSEEFDIKNPGVNVFSMEFFRKKFRVSCRKVVKILQFFDKRKLIFSQSCEVDGLPGIRLECPKLKDDADDYTQKAMRKMSGQNPNIDRILSGTIEVEVDKEEEVNKKQPLKNTKKLDFPLRVICKCTERFDLVDRENNHERDCPRCGLVWPYSAWEEFKMNKHSAGAEKLSNKRKREPGPKIKSDMKQIGSTIDEVIKT